MSTTENTLNSNGALTLTGLESAISTISGTPTPAHSILTPQQELQLDELSKLIKEKQHITTQQPKWEYVPSRTKRKRTRSRLNKAQKLMHIIMDEHEWSNYSTDLSTEGGFVTYCSICNQRKKVKSTFGARQFGFSSGGTGYGSAGGGAGGIISTSSTAGVGGFSYNISDTTA